MFLKPGFLIILGFLIFHSNAIAGSLKDLGVLEPWQKVIIEEEVLPQSQRFARDQSPTSSPLSLEWDLKLLKQYLVFYGPKLEKLKKSPNNLEILVTLSPESDCPKCMESVPSISSLIRQSLQRRGLTAVFSSLSSVKPKSPLGTMQIQWAPFSSEMVDAVGGDEKRYRIQTDFSLVGFVNLRKERELSEFDAFDGIEARLLTDLWIDLGRKWEDEKDLADEDGKEEILIEISGFTDFTQYNRLRTLLQTQLKNILSIEERKFSKNRVVFSVYSLDNKESVRKQVTNLHLDAVARVQ